MAVPGICVLCLADTCASEVHPVFNPVAPYGYLLPHMYLFIATGQVGLGVGSWPSNRATEGSNPKGTRLYFVILLKNEEKIFDWH